MDPRMPDGFGPEKTPTTIASLYKHSKNAFQELSQSLQAHDHQPEADVILRKEFRRFVVWAENMGAHRSMGRMSLDHHLREAPQVMHTVVGLLEDLQESLKDGTSFLSGTSFLLYTDFIII